VFQHSLLAGVFAASLIPLFFLLWRNTKAKIIAGMGALGATVMTMTSNGSTPLLTYVAGVLAICLWLIRKKMRTVRWAIAIAIIGLALVMKAPVWFVLTHIDLTGSSSGYQRAELIDTFMRHISDWWLMGTKDTASWGFDMWDVQNQFVLVGDTGGLIALIAFICVITRCFARIGNARKAIEGHQNQERFMWLLGATLFSYCTAFFGVNLFDQSKMTWLLLLSLISAGTAPILQSHSKTELESDAFASGMSIYEPVVAGSVRDDLQN
jgi:hypothetical protein